jgi:hypothetical protein
MIGKILSAVRGIGSATEFEGYLSNIWVDEAGGQGPTIEEARKQYRVMINERSAFIGSF